jgi:hypothetical protein
MLRARPWELVNAVAGMIPIGLTVYVHVATAALTV